REQPFDRFVDVGVAEILAGADAGVVTDGFGIDATVAANLDAADDSGLRDRRRCKLQRAGAGQYETDRKGGRRSGAQQTGSCLHWALKPFILVVPTARNPYVAVNSATVLPVFSIQARLRVNMRLLNP